MIQVGNVSGKTRDKRKCHSHSVVITRCYNNPNLQGDVLWPELCVREGDPAVRTVVHIHTPVGAWAFGIVASGTLCQWWFPSSLWLDAWLLYCHSRTKPPLWLVHCVFKDASCLLAPEFIENFEGCCSVPELLSQIWVQVPTHLHWFCEVVPQPKFKIHLKEPHTPASWFICSNCVSSLIS